MTVVLKTTYINEIEYIKNIQISLKNGLWKCNLQKKKDGWQTYQKNAQIHCTQKSVNQNISGQHCSVGSGNIKESDNFQILATLLTNSHLHIELTERGWKTT